jgi:hypothetical protein
MDEHGFIIPDINGKRHFGANGVDCKTVACGMVECVASRTVIVFSAE